MNYLRKFRLLNGITQDQIGLKSGVDQGIISRYERGLKKLSETQKMAIAKVLGQPIDLLFPPED